MVMGVISTLRYVIECASSMCFNQITVNYIASGHYDKINTLPM